MVTKIKIDSNFNELKNKINKVQDLISQTEKAIYDVNNFQIETFISKNQ